MKKSEWFLNLEKQIEKSAVRFEVFADHKYIPIDVAQYQIRQIQKALRAE